MGQRRNAPVKAKNSAASDAGEGVGLVARRPTRPEPRAHVVLLDPDVAKAFPDSAAVNAALAALLKFTDTIEAITARHARQARRPKG